MQKRKKADKTNELDEFSNSINYVVVCVRDLMLTLLQDLLISVHRTLRWQNTIALFACLPSVRITPGGDATTDYANHLRTAPRMISLDDIINLITCVRVGFWESRGMTSTGYLRPKTASTWRHGARPLRSVWWMRSLLPQRRIVGRAAVVNAHQNRRSLQWSEVGVTMTDCDPDSIEKSR